jgi:HD-like signal output (HDOD) protein
MARTRPAIDTPLTRLTLTPFDVTRKLVAELEAGEVRLPSFPDVAARVQRVLEDERATAAQIGKVLGADAALAARVLRLANSSVFNTSGKQVTDLPQAVNRLGHELVRSAAISFALRQMKIIDGDKKVRKQLHELWRKGTLVASIGYVLARETRAAAPDEALVTGILHNVGRLYLLVRAQELSSAINDSGMWDQMLHDWHPRIGRAILEHWKFPQPIVAAVADQNSLELPAVGASRLTDVLVASIALVPCVFYRQLLDDTVTALAPFQRLGLATADCSRLLAATAQQITGLRDALSG